MKLVKLCVGFCVAASALLSAPIFAQAKTAASTNQVVAKAEKVEKVVAENTTAVNSVSDKININTASAADIQKALIGIGAKKAEAIVQYREKFGKFVAPEQLLEVKGIGQATLDKNRDRFEL